MTSRLSDRLVLLVTGLTYILMVIVNALANILPINGITSGAVSDSYPNLFAPIGFTFSIWGLIYSLLLIFVIVLSVRYYKTGFDGRQNFRRVALLFSFTSIVNSVWIFTWHYRVIWLSLLLMLGILYGLIRISTILRDSQLTGKESILFRLPFSVYFGWITVATVANVTTFLVSIGWNRFGLNESLVTVVVLITAGIIGGLRMMKDASLAYGLVFSWAFYGILSKHLSPMWFDGQYQSVIWTLYSLLIVFLILEIRLVVDGIRTSKKYKLGAK